MPDLSTDQLIRKMGSPERMNFLLQSMSSNKVKLSKQIYNLETRNVKLFVKEQKQMERKQKMKDKEFKKIVNLPDKQYDENQLRQLEYVVSKKRMKPVFIQKAKTQPSEWQYQPDCQYQTKKSSIKYKKSQLSQDRFNPKRAQRISLFADNLVVNTKKNINEKDQANSAKFPHLLIRKKSNSFGAQKNNKKSSSHLNLYDSLDPKIKKNNSSGIKVQRSSPRKGQVLIENESQKLIEITDDKMSRFIKNLHQLLTGSYKEGKSLDQREVNRLLRQRYRLTDGILCPELTSQIKTFNLPYMEFVSQTQIRKSIHRIVNMSARHAQRVVFNLIDLNQNGVLDEKDLLCLIELAEKIPEIKVDFARITNYLFQEQNPNNSTISIKKNKGNRPSFKSKLDENVTNLKQKHIEKQNDLQKQKNIPKIRKLSIANSISQTSDSQNQRKYINSQKKTRQSGNLRFDKKKHFSFLETKQSFKKQTVDKQKCKIAITLQQFHKIFQNQKPTIFLDVLKYLFKIKKEDLNEPAKSCFQTDVQYKIPLASLYNQWKKIGFKNYNVDKIIQRMKKKFYSPIQIAKYQIH